MLIKSELVTDKALIKEWDLECNGGFLVGFNLFLELRGVVGIGGKKILLIFSWKCHSPADVLRTAE